MADSGITLKKSIDWLNHTYGFYIDEPIRTGVLFYKAVSSFKPDYYVDYLDDSPWIHMPLSSPRATYATLTRDYAILPMLGRSYWPMLAMLSLPYTGYAHAILCWCFILAYSDSNSRTAPDRAGSPPGSPWRRPLVPLIARAPIPIA